MVNLVKYDGHYLMNVGSHLDVKKSLEIFLPASNLAPDYYSTLIIRVHVQYFQGI